MVEGSKPGLEKTLRKRRQIDLKKKSKKIEIKKVNLKARREKSITHFLQRKWETPQSTRSTIPEHLVNSLLVKAANEAGVLVVHTGFMRPQNEGWGLCARHDSGFRSGQVILNCGSFDLKAADVFKLLE